MYEASYAVREEQNKDLRRYADNERLARQAQLDNQNSVLKNARQALGRSLVQAGEQLLNER